MKLMGLSAVFEINNLLKLILPALKSEHNRQ